MVTPASGSDAWAATNAGIGTTMRLEIGARSARAAHDTSAQSQSRWRFAADARVVDPEIHPQMASTMVAFAMMPGA